VDLPCEAVLALEDGQRGQRSVVCGPWPRLRSISTSASASRRGPNRFVLHEARGRCGGERPRGRQAFSTVIERKLTDRRRVCQRTVGERIIVYSDLGVKVVKNVRIPMEDGVRLAADVYLPLDGDLESSDRYPLVMEYTPYRKDDVGRPEMSWFVRLPQAGYPVVRVDIRGTGGSGGRVTDEYSEQEQRDGAAAVGWLADQPWCDGHVNMIGISYGGFTSLQVAALAPPHLTSIVPIDFTDDRYLDDCHYKGGLLRKYYDPGFYGNMMVASNALPPDAGASEEALDEVWQQHLAENEPYVLRWLRHQVDGPYWRNGSAGDVADQIRCPVFMIGGWRDGYTNPPFRLWERLTVPRKLLVGPWNHAVPDVGVPGPRIDYLRSVIRWLDHWCKGDANQVLDEPPVVVYMQRYDRPDPDRLDMPGEWRAEVNWPVPGAFDSTLHLGAGGMLSSGPTGAAEETLRYHPTVGTCAGLWSGGVPFGLPGDQRPDEALSLVYTSDPLEEDVHVLGRPIVRLRVSSSTSVIGFCASLAEVGPDGSSHLVAKGILNITRRASFGAPEPLEPGTVADIEIPIDATGWTFTRGNRIRLAIANADWPNIWPTPHLATSKVHVGNGISTLVLPALPAEPGAPAPVFDPSPSHVTRRVDAEAPPSWRVVEDVLTGRKTLDAAYTRRGDPISFGCTVDPSQPARARAYGHVEMRRQRHDSEIVAVSDMAIEGTETHFNVTIDLAVDVDGEPHFERRWAESIPREFL
jgi:putative CocE/NonD family hydrolase